MIYTNVMGTMAGSPLLEDTSLNKVLIAAKIFIHIYLPFMYCLTCLQAIATKLRFYLSVAQSEVNGLKHTSAFSTHP